ncbi:hypothetical protein GIB67_013281 [Kingdonia uniflora]|uniref:DRBM domain-containing protein n=1 Tax=Kingdonia uniflora TaxID=39325 RepID=A0A7J7N6A7_9MAGN|nr:hypothetical protein GIB67_013281 [Kingdonia uniflora]
MFKNQLQELAQRSCFNLPSYACIRQGPDHAPRFKSIVNFNGETFESPTFCATLRQAEHSAAEVALNALAERGPSRSLAARVLVVSKNGAWSDFISAKFFTFSGEIIKYYKSSSIWPGVKAALEIVRENPVWVIGDGTKADIWRDVCAFNLIRDYRPSPWWSKYVWNHALHPKGSLFLWRLACGVLPTDDIVSKKGICVTSWPIFDLKSAFEVGSCMSPFIFDLWRGAITYCLYFIWSTRNKCTYEDKEVNLSECKRLVLSSRRLLGFILVDEFFRGMKKSKSVVMAWVELVLF